MAGGYNLHEHEEWFLTDFGWQKMIYDEPKYWIVIHLGTWIIEF